MRRLDQVSYRSGFSGNGLLSWVIGAALALAACGSPLDQDVGLLPEDDVELAELEQGLSAGFTLSGCSNAESSKLYDAMDVLLSDVTAKYDDLLACVESANLLEYRGHTPRQIVDNLASASVTRIQCTALDDASADAPVSISSSRLRIDRGFLNDSSKTRVAAVIAHELMHNRGYSHSVNDAGDTYYPLTVPEQVERCIATRAGARAPNAWPGPGQAPSFSRIVGMHAKDACNCVYLRDGYAACGATDYLTGSTNTYRRYEVAPGLTPSDIVGITQAGSTVCAIYDDKTVSCGTQSGCNPVKDFAATRTLYDYTLPPGQRASDIVGVGGDDDNGRNYFWFSDGRVSSGTTDDLDRHRDLYGYDLAGGYEPADVVEMVSDGSFNCAFYRDGKVSCGTTDDLESKRRLYDSKF